MSVRPADDLRKMLDRGQPTAEGLRLIERVRDALTAVIAGHDDHTGLGCRVDLAGHDCCYTCNLAAAALNGALRDEPAIAAGEYD